MTLSLRFGAVTDIGRTRKKNDDSGYAGPNFVMVADGMGGAAAGDLASAVAVQTMSGLDAPAPADMLEALGGAVQQANDKLAELIDEDPAVEGMGTTVTAALFDGARIGVAHLGDSRGYLWHDGELLRITDDHTWVQSLIDEGRITEDEATTHSHRSLLLKVLDGRHDNVPDLTLYDVAAGDRILICSDGLSGFVDHERIARVMAIGTADSVAAELTQLALEAGSSDNVTVIVADVVDEPGTDAAPLVVGSAAEASGGALGKLRAWSQRDEADPAETPPADPDADPEELRYAPRPPGRFRGFKRLIATVVVLGVLAALGVLAYNWSQQQYYVAAFEGKVAIYQGVRADIPGLDLDHVYETENLLLSELPGFRRNQVIEGMTAGNLEDARQIVSQLESFARTCATQATESPSPTEATETRPNETARTETPPTETASPRTESATSGPTKGSEPTRTSRAQPTGQNSTLTSPDRTGEGSGDRPRPTERTTRPTEKTDPAEASGPTRPTDPPETEPSDTDEEAAECSGATPVTETTR